MPMKLLDGERDWLTQVTSDLPNDLLKLVYADWLDERGEETRAQFLRAFVEAAAKMKLKAFPPVRGLDEEWLDLIGYRLLKGAAKAGQADLREPLRRLARPALRIVASKRTFIPQVAPLGASKIGGNPDLPPNFEWPTGDTCRATYNDPTAGETRLAGFVAQINLAEIAHTQAARDLPKSGLLSFFCFQDWENDNPDKVGVRCAFIRDTTKLVGTPSPTPLTTGNEALFVQSLTFLETLDIPYPTSGPWNGEYGVSIVYDSPTYNAIRELQSANFENMLGYGRATTGDDPTPDKDHRHLIFLRSKGTEGLHIQIHQDDLRAANFDAIKLAWVDFD